MDSIWSVTALAACGLGLDICGAGILARGLFQSEREIISVATTEVRINAGELSVGPFGDRLTVGHPTLLLSRVEDRIDGLIGFLMLASGFLTQAAAVVVSVVDPPGKTGGSVALGAVGAMAATMLAAAALYVGFRRRLTARLLDRVLSEPGVHPHFADACRRQFRDPSAYEPPHTAQR